MKYKKWLMFMSGKNSLEDLKELIEPVKSVFDGIVAVYHGDSKDEEYLYLDSVKGAGKIILLEYCRRHDFSRNHYLFLGPQKIGDWCCQIDVLERLNPVFASELDGHIEFMALNKVNMIYYYGKPFLFSFHDSLQYMGNPHEGLRRLDGKGIGMEFSQMIPIENNVRFNVRPIKRPDKYHFVDHYTKYYLFPYGSNHCLLGIEKHGNPQELFPIRDARRNEFISYLREENIDVTVSALKDYILNTKPEDMEPNIRRIFNEEKILNDFYRYHVTQDRSFSDDHDWKNLIKI